jgi:multicomponent Na+:H+ antiporter subunit G
MTVALDLVSWLLIAGGGGFCIAGALGLIRMPDLYTRMHAAGVIDPFGVCLIFAGLMIQSGFTLVSAKLLILMLLLFFTSPVACHALAKAALIRGLKPLLAKKGGRLSKT